MLSAKYILLAFSIIISVQKIILSLPLHTQKLFTVHKIIGKAFSFIKLYDVYILLF